MRTAAEQFEAEEALAAECMALEFAIRDAGGWAEYVKLRDQREG